MPILSGRLKQKYSTLQAPGAKSAWCRAHEEGRLFWMLRSLRSSAGNPRPPRRVRRACCRRRGALPAPLPGAPGCSLLVSPDVLELQMTDAGGNASHPVAVPNNAALTGLSFYYQWAVWDPTVNAMNIVTSDGGIATVGQ